MLYFHGESRYTKVGTSIDWQVGLGAREFSRCGRMLQMGMFVKNATKDVKKMKWGWVDMSTVDRFRQMLIWLFVSFYCCLEYYLMRHFYNGMFFCSLKSSSHLAYSGIVLCNKWNNAYRLNRHERRYAVARLTPTSSGTAMIVWNIECCFCRVTLQADR